MASTPPPLEGSRIVLGGYTPETGGHAEGVSAFVVHSTGSDAVQVSAAGLPSPSYLIAHPDRPWLFAAGEGTPGQVSSLAVGAGGGLEVLSTATVTGDGSCQLALTPDGRHLVVANYGSGSISSFAVAPDGTLSEQLDLLQFAGSGPDQERQEAPHAHQVVAHAGELLVCDLGTDLIHRVTLDDTGHFGAAGPPVQLPGGTGPRHLVVVEEHLVVACELSAEVWLGRPHTGGWREAARVPSSAAAGEARVYPSGIVADGRRVFVANRGPGTVAVFDVDLEQGALVPVAEFGCGGTAPRDLTLSRGRVWVANEPDDLVSVYPTSALPDAELEFELAAPSPSCVVLLSDPSW
jgi:6-phosphogluconolactonase